MSITHDEALSAVKSLDSTVNTFGRNGDDLDDLEAYIAQQRARDEAPHADDIALVSPRTPKAPPPSASNAETARHVLAKVKSYGGEADMLMLNHSDLLREIAAALDARDAANAERVRVLEAEVRAWREWEKVSEGKSSPYRTTVWPSILKARAERAEAERDAARAERLPHMCRDDHTEIRHADSTHERCPLCRMMAERDRWKREAMAAREFMSCYDSTREGHEGEPGIEVKLHTGEELQEYHDARAANPDPPAAGTYDEKGSREDA